MPVMLAGLSEAALAQPVTTKSFAPSTIAVGGTVTLTFDVVNPSTTVTLTGVAFTDTLPAGLLIATPANLNGFCTGGSSGVASGSSGGNTTSLSNTTLVPSSHCTYNINVTATTPGVKINSTGAVSSSAGPGAAGTAILTVTGSSSTTLASSQNPSEFGKPVTFTATVTAGATGTVTFFDGATALGTVPLAGGTATFTTSSLTIGTHSITATYNGDAIFSASTSAALLQSVATPADSLRLRQLQILVSKIEAQNSGQAISGAIDNAIGEGFSEQGGQLVAMTGNGLRINFAAEPGQQADGDTAAKSGAPFGSTPFGSPTMGGPGASLTMGAPGASARAFAPEQTPARVDNAFAALGYNGMPAKAPPPPLRVEPKPWLLWADIRGTNFSMDASRDLIFGQPRGDISGGQVNALAGLTRRITPNLLVGVLGGYEHFDYSSQVLNGRLKGDGWTVGGYFGWRILTGLRFDVGGTYSGVNYNGIAGTASGSFPGSRWLVSAGFTGNYQLQRIEIEPSARVYALWERENAYVDSLGTAQADRNFSTGRASTGVKVLVPWYVTPDVKVSPYAGVYADYYFSNDNSPGILLLPTTFIDGWSGRVVGGVSATMRGGASLAFGAEYGGIGNNFQAWTLRGRAGFPITAQ
jgi:uncharacterized repeat protein (TIGR01451 family)